MSRRKPRQWWWAAAAAMALAAPGARAQQHGDKVMERLDRVMELLEQEELGDETRMELKHLVASLKRELAGRRAERGEQGEGVGQREQVEQREAGRREREESEAARNREIERLAKMIRQARERAEESREDAERARKAASGASEAAAEVSRQNLHHYLRGLHDAWRGEDEDDPAKTIDRYRRALRLYQEHLHDASEHGKAFEALKQHMEQARRQLDQKEPGADFIHRMLQNAKKAWGPGAHAEALKALKDWQELDVAELGELLKSHHHAERLSDLAERIHGDEGLLREMIDNRALAEQVHWALLGRERAEEADQPAEQAQPAPGKEELERMLKELREELHEVRSMVDKIRDRARRENGSAR